jgi:NADPH-dependent curcumin reductase CurA
MAFIPCIHVSIALSIIFPQILNLSKTQTVAKVAFDSHITAICSGKNADFVKSLGADEVIDYATQDINRALASNVTPNQRYDLVVDCVGGTELLSSYVYNLSLPSSSPTNQI